MIFKPGKLPLTVIMITLNEAHNLPESINQLNNWAAEVCILDSFSTDKTKEIALKFGVRFKQRKFTYFGDHWNYALNAFNVSNKYTMKLDPDERLTDQLKINIENKSNKKIHSEGFDIKRVGYFLGRKLLINQKILRIWKTGKVKFSDVLVNEHPLIQGKVENIEGDLLHNDSPNLEHWVRKQNSYSSAEAQSRFNNQAMTYKPSLFGDANRRRMWLKKNFYYFPFRYSILFYYYYIYKGLFKCGKEGYIWSHLRVEVMRMREFKFFELSKSNKRMKDKE